MPNSYDVIDHSFDVIVLGARRRRPPGRRSAIGRRRLEHGLHYQGLPDRAATPSRRKAGSAPPLGNVEKDDWRWHMFDTVRGSDWLGRPGRDCIHVPRGPSLRSSSSSISACRSSRTDAGKIYQRPFGGHTTEYAKGPMAHRAAAAADRTGHAILHTLYQQCLSSTARDILHRIFRSRPADGRGRFLSRFCSPGAWRTDQSIGSAPT